MKTNETKKFEQKMTKEDFNQILKNGFNASLLAAALYCSVGRINELRKEPVEGQIYHTADINTNAIYDFATAHEIDLASIDYTEITKIKEKQVKKTLNVGSKLTKTNEEIIKIQKVGNTNVYMTDKFNVYSAKEVIEKL